MIILAFYFDDQIPNSSEITTIQYLVRSLDGLVVIILASNSGDLISNPDIGIIFLMNAQKVENKLKKWVGLSPIKKS